MNTADVSTLVLHNTGHLRVMIATVWADKDKGFVYKTAHQCSPLLPQWLLCCCVDTWTAGVAASKLLVVTTFKVFADHHHD
jgi:hypothetical protein